MTDTGWTRMGAATPRWAGVLLALAAVVIFALSPLVGSIASVVAVLLVLATTPAAFAPGWRQTLIAQPGALLLTGAFVALTLAFVVTARAPADVSFALNFLALPAVAVICLVARGSDRTGLLVAVFNLCLAGAIFGALVAVVSVLMLGMDRGQGFAGGPNLLPRIAIPLGLAAAGALLVVSGKRRLIYYAGPAAAAVATLFSGSRGAAVALAVLVVMLAGFMLSRRDLRRDLWVLVILCVLASALGALVVPELAERFTSIVPTAIELLTTGTTVDSPTDQRLDGLVFAPDAFLAAPLFGWGWANMGAAVGSAGAPPEVAAIEHYFFHADLANFAVGAGVLGLAAWLAILLSPLVGVAMAGRDAMHGARLYVALMLAVSFAVFGLTDYTLGYDLPTTLFAFLTATLLVSAPPRSSSA